MALALDVTRAEEIETVIDRIVGELGSLDIVVNNAGVNSLVHRVTIDEYPAVRSGTGSWRWT